MRPLVEIERELVALRERQRELIAERDAYRVKCPTCRCMLLPSDRCPCCAEEPMEPVVTSDDGDAA